MVDFNLRMASNKKMLNSKNFTTTKNIFFEYFEYFKISSKIIPFMYISLKYYAINLKYINKNILIKTNFSSKSRFKN